MIDFLVWLLAVYGCTSIMVQLLNHLTTCALVQVGDTPVHYQLLLYNSEHSLEAAMRSLLSRSRFYGNPITVSFKDQGSTDDTLHIASIYERSCSCISQQAELDAKHMITIDLRRFEKGGD